MATCIPRPSGVGVKRMVRRGAGPGPQLGVTQLGVIKMRCTKVSARICASSTERSPSSSLARCRSERRNDEP